MKLYDSWRAPNPRRVRWVMAEKEITDLEIVNVDLLSGEHRTPEYRAKVGFAHVPALELDDGRVISESVAICRYLESVYPEPNLFGRDAAEQAVVEMWTRRLEIYLANPLMLTVRYTHPALSALEAPRPEVAAWSLEGAERMMRSLNRRLEGREFVAADRITMADVVAVCGLDFTRMIKYRPPEELTHLNRWYAAMRERPAAKAGV